MGSFTSKGLQVDKSDLRNALGQPPPEGLVPIGDMGIYVSPHVKEDKPVSPLDCENYPDSPFCGGNPWTKVPVGIDLEFTANECGTSVTGTPILGFTKLPPISIAWIAPECRADYPEQGRLPETPGIPDASKIPDMFFPDVDENAVVLMIVSYNSDSFLTRMNPPGDPLWRGITKRDEFVSAVRSNFRVRNTWSGRDDTILFTIKGRYRQWQDEVRLPGMGQPYSFESLTDWESYIWADYNKVSGIEVWTGDRGKNQCLYGKYRDIKNLKTSNGNSYWAKQIAPSTSPGQEGFSAFYFTLLHFEVIKGSSGRPNPDDYNKRKCCDMACCDSGQAQQRQRDQDNSEILALLREINKKLGNFPVKVNIFDSNENAVGAQAKVESISNVAQGFFRAIAEIEKALKCIGIDQLPIYAPSSIIDDESNGVLGDLNDLKNQIFRQRIESIAEMMIWRAKNDNEIFGRWQETIILEDSDPTKKGNQPKKIVLPNMARTFRELILLNSTQTKVLGMVFDTLLKLYIDVANTKISTATCEAILRDVQDYLDYPTDEKYLDVPVGINIPKKNDSPDDKEDLERFLRNSTAKAKFDDWTGEGSLTQMLLILLKAAEGQIGQNFNPID